MSESDTTGTVAGFGGFTHFGGLDWARYQHQMVVVDPTGRIVLSLAFANDADGWARFRQKVSGFPRLAVAVETNCGPAVERLLEAAVSVYPMNPKAATRYRDRKAPAGAKDDELDAWSFADALRTDGHGWRELAAQDPLTAELRLLCRDEVKLISQRTALVNQLQAALCEYYPAALDAFDDWTGAAGEGPWRFLLAFPDPQTLVKAGKRKWEKFLHTHKLYRPQTAEKRLAVFADAARSASPNPAVTRAKSLLAVSLATQLCLLQSQLDEYRDRIASLFRDHPDHDCFGSLPGAGPKIAPRLLSELGSNRQVFSSAEALQNYAGTSPLTRQSGKVRIVSVRYACNKTLRSTVHLWAELSRRSCAWAEAYYQKKREEGMAHAAAIRCLGQRWIKILWKMWQENKPYDEARHTLDQVKHGSWVVKLLPEKPTATPA
jgi:transposase